MSRPVLDAVIIGGDIAGVSFAAFAARDGVRAELLEMEFRLPTTRPDAAPPDSVSV